MNVADLVSAMETIAPTRFAAPWDNVGLLVGDPTRDVARLLLAIDCTRPVLDEAARLGCGAIVAYHPPIFDAQKSFVAGSIAYEAARAEIAIYSPHTALDVADGGTNDVLADALGMTDRAPLRVIESVDVDYKLVTFVPVEHAEAVSQAVFSAGAGRIGKYSSCSFRALGTGTFFGEDGTTPAVGESGRLEQAPELRLETVVPIARVQAVVRALRAAHPYEEPAFDLVRLATAAEDRGIGRVGPVARETVRAFIERVKSALGVTHVLVAGSPDRVVTRAAVCAGSGGDLVPDAINAGAELFLTGELRHHDVLRAVASDMGVICALHSSSERAVLSSLERFLGVRLPDVEIAAKKIASHLRSYEAASCRVPGRRGHSALYFAKYVVALFCPLLRSIRVESPSLSTRGSSLASMPSSCRICSALSPSLRFFTSVTIFSSALAMA
jgi:dinuclear metal center YbgI/SA1388 family protein